MSKITEWLDRVLTVHSPPMTSTGSQGATYIGHNSPRAEEVEKYRSRTISHENTPHPDLKNSQENT